MARTNVCGWVITDGFRKSYFWCIFLLKRGELFICGHWINTNIEIGGEKLVDVDT